MLLLLQLLLEKTENIYTSQSLSPIDSSTEKVYIVELTMASSLIPLAVFIIVIEYDSFSPLRENGLLHMATSVKPSTVMLRSTGGFGSAIQREDVNTQLSHVQN